MDTSDFVELMNGYVAPVSSSVPGLLCQNHSLSYIYGLRAGARWAKRMWDATAKIQTGLLFGNLNYLGHFDECINVHENGNPSANFSGEYCLATFKPNIGATDALGNAVQDMINEEGEINVGLGELVSKGLRWGFCIPSSCTSEDLSVGLTAILGNDTNLEVSINRSDCVSNEPIPFTTADWIAMIVFCILLCTVLLSTGYELITEYLMKNGHCAKTPSDLTLPSSGPLDENKTTYTVLTSSPLGTNEAQKSNARTRTSPIMEFPCEWAQAERPKTLPLLDINAPETHLRTPTPSSGVIHDFNCSRTSYTSSSLSQMEIPLRESPEEESRILPCFSLVSNGIKLFNFRDTKVLLRSIDGIKVLSLFWVVIAHACFVTEGLPTINYISFRKNIREWHTMMILNSQLAADTFLVCTGALISYTFLRDMRKRGIYRRYCNALSRTGMSKKFLFKYLPLFYLQRYLRLTPALATVILLHVNLLSHMGSGPFWGSGFQYLADNCQNHWWGSLLYIQNFLCGLKICLAHSWYLMVDMQLYIFSPIILLGFLCWTQRRNLITVGVVILMGVISTFARNYIHKLPAGFLYQPTEWIHKVELDYIKPNLRIAPWLIGMVLGYLLHHHRRQEILKPSLPKWLICTGWVLAPLFMIYALFGLLAFEYLEGISHIWSAMYSGGSHSIWAMGIAWIIFASETNHGGIAEAILHFKIFRPWSRLSYCIYLVHVPVMMYRALTLRSPAQITGFGSISLLFGDLFFSILLAIALTLFVEMPIVRLYRAITIHMNFTVRFSPARPSKKILAQYAPLIAELNRSYAAMVQNEEIANRTQPLSGAFAADSIMFINSGKLSSPTGSKRERKPSPIESEASSSGKSTTLPDGTKQCNKKMRKS